MHILLTANASWNIANFRLPLVEALLSDGHRLTVLAPADPSVARLEAAGCRLLSLKMDLQGLNPLQDLALMARMRRFFRREQPDLILSFTIKNNIYGALAAKSLGIPFIPNVTGLGTAFLSGDLLQRLAGLLYRLAFRKLPFVLFQNAEDRGLFLNRGLITEAQARRVPGSGIDLADFPPAPWPDRPVGQGPVFLMIARLLRDKGVYEYVAAARALRQSHPSARFRLVGAAGGENRSAISASEAQAWHEAGIVEWLGPVQDVRPHIAEADCVVLPSYREGAPRALIEAGALCRPVIATDVPGCREVIVDGETGLLCTVRDSASLAAACQKFAEMPLEERCRMGRAGRARIAATYDVAHVTRVYRDVIALAFAGRGFARTDRRPHAQLDSRPGAGLISGKQS